MRKTAFILIIFLFPLFSQASGKGIKNPGSEEELGWNFYWDEPEAEQEKLLVSEENRNSKKKDDDISKHETFSVEWFRAAFPVIRDRAIENPSKENITALLYTEKILMDKSEVFARKRQYYRSLDPNLQEDHRLPLTKGAQIAFNMDKKKQQIAAMNELAKKSALFFFYDHECKFCKSMIEIINTIERESDFTIVVVESNKKGRDIPRLSKTIKIKNSDSMIKAFGIKFWPAVALFEPEKRDSHIIAQGAVYGSELRKRMVNVGFETGLLSNDWYFKVFPEEKGLTTKELYAGIPKDIANDPVKLINYTSQMMNKTDDSDNEK